MDTQLFGTRLGILLKQNYLFLILFTAGLLLLAYGLYSSLFPSQEGVIIETASSDQTRPETYFIDVEGAVNRPGVYELESSLRIQDALIAAGGLAADADRERIAVTINLAQKLSDGLKVYFPFVGDTIVLSTGEKSVAGVTSDSLLNLNTASEVDLVALNGIGPATAKKIVAARPFTSVEELKTKKILSSKTYEQLKDQLIVQ